MSSVYLEDTIDNVTRVKFRSGFGLQARELNAVQSALGNQISAIGDHLFKDGSAVVGGSVKFENALSLLVESSFNGTTVDLASMVGNVIVELDSGGVETGAKGKVIAVSEETDTESAAIHYINTVASPKIGATTDFTTVRLEDSSAFATIKTSETPVRDCSMIRVLDGIFYYNQKFVSVESQLLVYSKFSTDYSGYVGITFSEDVVTEFDSETLYDPARGSENYNAPGAHREVVSGTLEARLYSDGDLPSNYIVLSELQSGAPKTLISDPRLNVLGDLMATEQYDTHGDFVKELFKADIIDFVEKPIVTISPSTASPLIAQATTAYPHDYSVGDSVTITSGDYVGTYTIDEILSTLEFSFTTPSAIGTTDTNTTVYRNDYFGVQVSAGKAYVKGYPIELPSTNFLEVKKALTTDTFNNNLLSSAYSQYLVVDNLVGMFDISTYTQVNLLDVGLTQIGTARARAIELDNGTEYRLYLFDVQMDVGQDSANVTSVTAVSSLSTITATADVVGAFNLVGVDSRPTVFPINDYVLSTTSPLGVDSISYVSQIVYSQPSAGGIVTFNTSGSNTFFGSTVSELASTSTLSDNYIFIDSVSGAVLTPTSAIISASATSITVDVGVTSTILMVGATTVSPATKTKTEVTVSETITAGTITSTNRSADLSNADILTFSVSDGANDITSSFTLDNGQRDTFYDVGSITLNAGSVVPTTNLIVTYTYASQTGQGAFTVDSYSGFTNEIPNYTLETSGDIQSLRNVLDYRPTISGGAFANNLIPSPDASIAFDFNYYLARRDLVVLSKTGALKVIEGIPSLSPEYPNPSENDMVLFRIEVDQLTETPSTDVNLNLDQHRRYTMRDIGIIDRRVDRLEYETSLSLLESSTKQIDVIDQNGDSRFKTGFLVDNFVGHAFGDTQSADYRVAIDKQRNELRPMFEDDAIGFEPKDITNMVQVGTDESGYFLTLPYTSTALLSNPLASKSLSLNPYLVTRQEGVLSISPSSDYWVDRTTRPVRNIDLNDDVPSAPANFGGLWDEWSRAWTGQNVNQTVVNTAREQLSTTVAAVASPTTSSLGSFLVDVGVSQWIRAQTLTLNCVGLREDTDLHVFIDGISVNGLVTSTTTSPISEGAARSDSVGSVTITIDIPNGVYRTGERVIAISDEANNVTANASTNASAIFTASGLINTDQEVAITTRPPVLINQSLDITRNTTTNNFTTINRITNNIGTANNDNAFGDGDGGNDPLAQTFHISENSFNEGCFITDLNIYFSRKPSNSVPITVQIRPVVNGYPDSYRVVPLGQKVIQNSEVNIPTLTNDITTVRSTPTNVVFDAPVYLKPNTDYCVVMLTTDSDYECFVSEMGQVLLGTEDVIRKQPILGSLFRSQNSKTWTAYQNEDLMIDINIAQFPTATAGSFNLDNEITTEDKNYNLIRVEPQYLEFDNADVDFTLTTTDASTLGNSTNDLNIRTNTTLSTEQIVRTGQVDCQVGVTCTTNNQFVAPYFDLDRQWAVIVKNRINYYGLVEDGFFIDAVGGGYTDATVSATVSGGDGIGALITPTIVGGEIQGITVDDGGSGYISQPTINISDTGAGGGAIVSYLGFETDSTGGNALAKYLSKPITLADTFETDQLDCYLDIFAPAQTDVEIYIRQVSATDTTPIQNRPWVLVSTTNKRTSQNDEFVETKFTADLSYVDDNGATQLTAKTVQVKIVLLSTNTSVVPRVKNFRAISTI